MYHRRETCIHSWSRGELTKCQMSAISLYGHIQETPDISTANISEHSAAHSKTIQMDNEHYTWAEKIYFLFWGVNCPFKPEWSHPIAQTHSSLCASSLVMCPANLNSLSCWDGTVDTLFTVFPPFFFAVQYLSIASFERSLCTVGIAVTPEEWWHIPLKTLAAAGIGNIKQQRKTQWSQHAQLCYIYINKICITFIKTDSFF